MGLLDEIFGGSKKEMSIFEKLAMMDACGLFDDDDDMKEKPHDSAVYDLYDTDE